MVVREIVVGQVFDDDVFQFVKLDRDALVVLRERVHSILLRPFALHECLNIGEESLLLVEHVAAHAMGVVVVEMQDDGRAGILGVERTFQFFADRGQLIVDGEAVGGQEVAHQRLDRDALVRFAWRHAVDEEIGGGQKGVAVHVLFVANLLHRLITEAKADAKIAEMKAVDYERIGEREYVEFLLVHDAGDGARLAELCKKAAATERAVIIDTESVDNAKLALAAIGDTKPLLNGANKDNYEAMNAIAGEAGVVLGVKGADLAELHDTVAALEKLDNKNLVIDVTGATVKETFANAVLVRRTALKDGDRTFGYPSIVNLAKLCRGDVHMETALAAVFTMKYGSIVAMETMRYAEALPLYGLRQNIFTDPQKPMKVAPGIYPINGAGPDDPCALTVDFALTYFLVSGELERSKVPVNLLITDASGMSVLTAWAAGKFSSGSIKKFFDEYDVAGKINNRTLIIPGKAAVMKGDIQDKLPDWNVVVGTREAVELVKYLRDGEHVKAAEAVAASKKPADEKKAVVDADAPLDFEKIAMSIPEIKVVDMGVSYKQRDPNSPKFVTIGERIHCISPVIREAMNNMDPEPILKRAAEQIKAGATYLDVNIGPAESNGPELMTWAVKLLQENFNNVPLALDTANKKAIEAGIRVYNRTNGKPIVNSADAGSRISNIDLAAANDAIVIALCSADGIAKDNEERMMHCHHMLERGLSLGMDASGLWFDPLFLVVKGMQDKQMDVLNAIKMFADEGLKSTGGLSNNSNGAPKAVRPILDSTLVAMAMMQGLTSAIVNPNDLRLMETIKSCDIFKNHVLYSDSYLDE